jgi:hypothetical protein
MLSSPRSSFGLRRSLHCTYAHRRQTAPRTFLARRSSSAMESFTGQIIATGLRSRQSLATSPGWQLARRHGAMPASGLVRIFAIADRANQGVKPQASARGPPAPKLETVIRRQYVYRAYENGSLTDMAISFKKWFPWKLLLVCLALLHIVIVWRFQRAARQILPSSLWRRPSSL